MSSARRRILRGHRGKSPIAFPRAVLAGLIALVRGTARPPEYARAAHYLPDTAPFTMPPDD